ncbi:MAG TPA: FtsX-like permease family protein [Vicinamibacterales bacterium]|nr:FtsX-like permease family protein [Vicinamibacterales bacterium]
MRAAPESLPLLTRSIADAIATVNKDLALTFRPFAGLGLYGVTSYTVSRRRGEIGIRMALGAAPERVIRLVLGRVSALVGIGLVVGAGLSLWVSQFVSTLLYGLEPRDPTTLAASAAVLAAVGAIAGWLPARRASRIDPAEVLRDS